MRDTGVIVPCFSFRNVVSQFFLFFARLVNRKARRRKFLEVGPPLPRTPNFAQGRPLSRLRNIANFAPAPPVDPRPARGAGRRPQLHSR